MPIEDDVFWTIATYAILTIGVIVVVTGGVVLTTALVQTVRDERRERRARAATPADADLSATRRLRLDALARSGSRVPGVHVLPSTDTRLGPPDVKGRR